MELKIERTGICGSDKHMYAGHMSLPFPIIPGHELVGTVEAMGAAVTLSVLFVCAKAAFGLAAFSTPETRDASVSEIAVKVRHADPRRFFFFSFRESRAFPAGEGARGSAAASASARGGYDRLATETYS